GSCSALSASLLHAARGKRQGSSTGSWVGAWKTPPQRRAHHLGAWRCSVAFGMKLRGMFWISLPKNHEEGANESPYPMHGQFGSQSNGGRVAAPRCGKCL